MCFIVNYNYLTCVFIKFSENPPHILLSVDGCGAALGCGPVELYGPPDAVDHAAVYRHVYSRSEGSCEFRPSHGNFSVDIWMHKSAMCFIVNYNYLTCVFIKFSENPPHIRPAIANRQSPHNPSLLKHSLSLTDFA